MRKTILFIALFLIALTTGTTTTKAEEPATVLGVDEVSSTEQYDYTKYRGKIGPYPITLFIDLSASQNEYCGYYYYNDRPKSRFTLIMKKCETMNLHGTMKVVLYEYSPQGKHTGTFNGQLEMRGDGFYGTFTNSKGVKYRFSLY